MKTRSTHRMSIIFLLGFFLLSASSKDASGQTARTATLQNTGHAIQPSRIAVAESFGISYSARDRAGSGMQFRGGGCSLVVTCPSDTAVDNDAGSCGAVISFTEPTGESLDCGIAYDDVFLSQSNNTIVITSPNSVSCNNEVHHSDNAYLRIYDPADDGISDTLFITDVEFAIEGATSSGGTQPVTVNLYLYDPSDPRVYASFDLIATKDTVVADQAQTKFNVPISAAVPPGVNVVVELYVPDGTGTENLFFIGSNSLGQTGPTYLASDSCSLPEPTNVASIGFPEMQIILNIYGRIVVENEVSVSLQSGLASGSEFPAGTTTSVYLIEDNYGNSQTCSVEVTVDDTESPSAACKDITVELGAGDEASITADDVDDGSSDNCAADLALSQTTFTLSDLGSNTVTLTASDDAGNSDECSADVEVTNLVAVFDQLKNVDWSVYPNPNAGRFAVEINNPDGMDLNLQLYNVLGEIVYSSVIRNIAGNISEHLDLSLARGFYQVVIEGPDGISTRSMAVQ